MKTINSLPTKSVVTTAVYTLQPLAFIQFEQVANRACGFCKNSVVDSGDFVLDMSAPDAISTAQNRVGP
jgi:hypothetical protein